MIECPQAILSNASSDPKSTELLPGNIHIHQHESFSDLSNGLQYPPKYFLAISTNMNNSVFCFSPKSKNEKIITFSEKSIISKAFQIVENKDFDKTRPSVSFVDFCNTWWVNIGDV